MLLIKKKKNVSIFIFEAAFHLKMYFGLPHADSLCKDGNSGFDEVVGLRKKIKHVLNSSTGLEGSINVSCSLN